MTVTYTATTIGEVRDDDIICADPDFDRFKAGLVATGLALGTLPESDFCFYTKADYPYAGDEQPVVLKKEVP